MSYTHLSIIERSKLEILHQQGKVPEPLPRNLADIMLPLAGNSTEMKQSSLTTRRLLRGVIFSVVRLRFPQASGRQSWPESSKRSFRRPGLLSRLLSGCVRKSKPSYASKRSIAGCTQAFWREGLCPYSGTKASVRSPQRLAASLR